MPASSEVQEKERRVNALLAETGHDSLIITRRSNFAWITGGGEAVASRVSPTSPVYLVITPEARYAVGYSMDLPWAMESVLDRLGYQGIALRPFGKTPEAAALELAEGSTAADDTFLGVDSIQPQLIKYHEPYTPEEMDRYRQLGADCAAIQAEAVRWIEPGMTERYVNARIWQMALERGLEGHYMFVGADDRIERFRHPVPSDKQIEKAVLLAPAVARWGLLASTSRLIYFNEPPDEIRRRYRTAATIEAALLARTRSGTPLAGLFALIMGLFEQLGYPDERHKHFHGGPVGYWAGYAERMQHPGEVVKPNMAFLYYLSLAGVHAEELMLVDDQGPAFVSIDPGWPRLSVEFEGSVIPVPDIYIK